MYSTLFICFSDRFAACCASFVTVNEISGLVPSIMYNNDLMMVWNLKRRISLTDLSFGAGIYPTGRGVGAVHAFCMPRHYKTLSR